MSAPVVALPAFHDLKKHVPHPGGFSDGGIICTSQSLTAQGVVIAPVPGTALGGFSLPASGIEEIPINLNVNLQMFNFDPDNDAYVDAFFVFKDGSQARCIPPEYSPPIKVPKNTPAGAGVSGIPLGGLIVTHPNKLLVKLVSYMGYALPTKRVLLKATLVEYDKPRDLGGS